MYDTSWFTPRCIVVLPGEEILPTVSTAPAESIQPDDTSASRLEFR